MNADKNADMPYRYELWKFFADNHGLILMDRR